MSDETRHRSQTMRESAEQIVSAVKSGASDNAVYDMTMRLMRNHHRAYRRAYHKATTETYAEVRRTAAEEMRERAAKWHDEQAAMFERDADAAASAGSYCMDSLGSLRRYAELHRGHAAAIRALEIEGNAT